MSQKRTFFFNTFRRNNRNNNYNFGDTISRTNITGLFPLPPPIAHFQKKTYIFHPIIRHQHSILNSIKLTSNIFSNAFRLIQYDIPIQRHESQTASEEGEKTANMNESSSLRWSQRYNNPNGNSLRKNATHRNSKYLHTYSIS